MRSVRVGARVGARGEGGGGGVCAALGGARESCDTKNKVPPPGIACHCGIACVGTEALVWVVERTWCVCVCLCVSLSQLGLLLLLGFLFEAIRCTSTNERVH